MVCAEKFRKSSFQICGHPDRHWPSSAPESNPYSGVTSGICWKDAKWFYLIWLRKLKFRKKAVVRYASGEDVVSLWICHESGDVLLIHTMIPTPREIEARGILLMLYPLHILAVRLTNSSVSENNSGVLTNFIPFPAMQASRESSLMIAAQASTNSAGKGGPQTDKVFGPASCLRTSVS